MLDARLRFPVHALPGERVVWAGTAHPRAFQVSLWRIVFFVVTVASVLIGFGLLLDHAAGDECQVKVDTEHRNSTYRDCTSAERVKRDASRADTRQSLAKRGGTLAALLLLAQWVANTLRRRTLIYIVTTERVVVQDGMLTLRLDTIDLDHVVSITAHADVIDRLYWLKSIALTVPGQRSSFWYRVPLANAVMMWGIEAQDPALSQLLNVWLPRARRMP